MKVAILHRFTPDRIAETNASFKYLTEHHIGVELDVKTFKKFDRLNPIKKLLKSIFWIFYSPFLVMDEGYDIIYCDDSFPFYPLLVKLACPDSKVVIRLGDLHLMYYCSGLIYNFFHLFEIWTWKKVDMIIAISETMAEYIRKESGRDVKVVLDPVDLDQFDISWYPQEIPMVIFHGTITKNKGLDRLIEASKKLPHIRFRIIGNGEDLERLKKIAPKNVDFTGWIDFHSIRYHLSIASVGIAMRSKNQGNEYVVTSPFLQYNALGVPCAVSHRKVFDDMGYPYQFETTDELVALIKKLIDKPKSWQGYVKTHHGAKKIGREIWYQLSSLETKSRSSSRQA